MRIIIKATCSLPQKRLEQAIARGLNEGGDKVRTIVRRALKKRTNVKAYKSITSRTAEAGKGYNRATPGRLIYAITATGKGIPILEFPVSVKTGPGGAVDAKSWGVDHVFKRSFREKNGALRARRGRERLPVRALYGPALPKEIVSGEIVGIWRASAVAIVPPLVLKQLARALS